VQEAQPWTVMSSYNLINGTYAPESRDLVTAILRGDWGFEGYVMTDWAVAGTRSPSRRPETTSSCLAAPPSARRS